MGVTMMNLRRSLLVSAIHKNTIGPTDYASFVTNLFTPLDSAIAHIAPIQSGSGDPSPTNIRPFTGLTGLTVYRTGKNLLSPHLYSGVNYNVNVGTIVNPTDNPVQFTESSPGVFTVKTTQTWRYFAFLLPIKPNQYYRVKYSASSTGSALDVSRGFISNTFEVLTKSNVTNNTQNYNSTIRSTNANVAYYYIAFSNGSTASTTLTWTEPQVEIGDQAATAYEAYNATTYPATWTDQGTVYAGSYDAVSGTLTITHKVISFDGTEGIWNTYSTDYVRCTRAYSTYNIKGESASISNIFANGGNTYTPANNCFGWKNDTLSLYLTFRLNGITDDRSETGIAVTKWKAQLADWAANDTPLTLMLALREQQTVALTPNQIVPLSGTNNMWNDSGQITVTYWVNG